jgi:integrase
VIDRAAPGRVDFRHVTLAVRKAKGDRPWMAVIPVDLDWPTGNPDRDREGRLFPISGRHAQRVIERMAREAGVVASAHALRHTVAMRVYRRTGDIEVVRAALGHASISTTQRYARAEESVVRRAVGA